MTDSLFRSARMITALTLVSRVLGFVRDMACGYAFGVRGVMSAFTVAFQIPNLFRRLFGEGALSAATIPVLTETLTGEGTDAADRLAGRVIAALVGLLSALCVVAEIGIGVWYWSTARHGGPTLVLVLTALMLPYLVLICTTAILGGVQNVFGRFAVPAAMPILLNIFMIAAAVGSRWAMPGRLEAGVVLLSVSVLVAGCVQLAVQYVMTRDCGLRLPLRLDFHDEKLRQIGRMMVPMVAGLGVVQLNTLADSLIAFAFVKETIVAGEPPERVGTAILYFAQRLYQFPLGVFSIALATAIFPTLARRSAEQDMAGLGGVLSKGFRIATFEALPCAVGLVLVREALVTAMLDRGEFAEWPEATHRVSFAVAMYAIGIWGAALNHLIVRAFYSLKDATTPLRVSVGMVVLNLALNLWWVNTPLKEAGLALATSVCSTLQLVLLLRLLHRRVGHLAWRDMGVCAAKVLLSTVLMAAGVIAAGRLTAAESSLIRLGAMVGAGGLTFIVAARLTRMRELSEVLHR